MNDKIGDSPRETNNKNISIDSEIIKPNNINAQKQIQKYFINKKYQLFISIIYFFIGSFFLYFLFSYVFSIYVSILIFYYYIQYQIGSLLLIYLITAEFYLSLGYFYFKKFQLNNLYGPSQICLIILQIIGIIFIVINYFINLNMNETFSLFLNDNKILFYGYLFSSGFNCFLFICTFILVRCKNKKKTEMYNVIK